MSWQTNKIIMYLRKLGRRVGFNSLFMSFVRQHSYEDHFTKALLPFINQGDYVWDVGANIGYYTQIFSDIVGPQGKVFAFEPSEHNFSRLSNNLKMKRNVCLLPYGLGDKNENVLFKQGEDELGATSRVVTCYDDDAEYPRQLIHILCADYLVENKEICAPNIVKIDVEGFELDVLMGMRHIFENNILKVIGIEIHFGLLEERALFDGPKKIELLLRNAGFKLTWPDASHVIAVRNV